MPRRTESWTGCSSPRSWSTPGGSQHRASLLLGIARQTLRLKLRDLGLLPVKAEAEEDNSL
jgi:hypothetical protein